MSLSGIAGRRKGEAMRRLASLVLFEFCMLALSAFAQHEGHESVGRVPREILERPVPLRQGIGKVHEEVTTSSPKAQAFYDQGLAYLHSFVWIEAARSFHQALRFEPSLAMAYLGLSDVDIGLQDVLGRSEEHTSELQSRGHLVCRL